MVKYSDPLMSALQAISRWSGECVGAAEVEESVALGLLVAVEEDALEMPVTKDPAHEGVLAALTVAREIRERRRPVPAPRNRPP